MNMRSKNKEECLGPLFAGKDDDDDDGDDPATKHSTARHTRIELKGQ
jgi:hypothetical protein